MPIPTNTVAVGIVRGQIQLRIEMEMEEMQVLAPLTPKEAMELADALLQASTRLMTAKMIRNRKDGD